MCAHLCYEPRYFVTLAQDDLTGGWLVIWSSNLLNYRDHTVYADLVAFGDDYPYAYHSDEWKPGKAPLVGGL